jgi:hypothetical protein
MRIGIKYPIEKWHTCHAAYKWFRTKNIVSTRWIEAQRAEKEGAI